MTVVLYKYSNYLKSFENRFVRLLLLELCWTTGHPVWSKNWKSFNHQSVGLPVELGWVGDNG
jgi:hypothetical protein